jgi:hypothetical protein
MFKSVKWFEKKVEQRKFFLWCRGYTCFWGYVTLFMEGSLEVFPDGCLIMCHMVGL